MRPSTLSYGFVASGLGIVAFAIACGSSGSDSSSASSSSGSSSSSSSGGTNPDAGPPALTQDGGGGDDAGPGGSTSAIACGSASCPLPNEHCCTYNNDQPPPLYAFSCASGTGCPTVANTSDAVALSCASAANCTADTVCCLSNDNTPTNVARCMPAADCKDDGTRVIRAQLCDRNATVTGCPPAEPCSTNNIVSWNLPPGYATCGGKGL